MSLLQTKRLTINGKTVRMLQGGSGKPVVFLHGWSTNPISHRESLELLANKFTIYAPFLFDLKFSKLSEMAEGVSDLIRMLKLKNSILAGTSFGGLIAALVAASGNHDDSRLLLINPAGLLREASDLQMSLDSIKSYFCLLFRCKFRAIIRVWLSGANFRLSFWKRGIRTLAKELRAKVHVCYVFKRIKAKTAIIWSNNDNIFPVSQAATLNALIKNSALVLVKGDHAWYYLEPRLFAQKVEEAATV